jgi:hypothetical protein
MIGSPDFHPHGYSARWPVVARQRGSLRALVSFQSTTTPTMKRKILLLAGRLRRFFNAWAAVAIAHHAHQAASAAQQQRDLQQLDSIRFYRGPIDQLFARWGLPQSQRPEQLQKSIARQQPTKIQGG